MTEITPATKSLLSQEEKNFLDDVPDEVVKRIFAADSDGIKVTFIPKAVTGVTHHEWHGDRAIAVRLYLGMLMDHGVRKEVRPNHG